MSVPDTAKLVQAFIRIRNARAKKTEEYNAEDSRLETDMRTIENELLRRAQEQGVDGFKTAHGTTYIGEEVHASIGDDDQFFTFMSAENDPTYLERRPSLKRIKEYQSTHDGATPPGIRLFRENRMRIRAK